MKTFIILLILAAACYFGYQEYFNLSNTVIITGNIQVSQQSNYNIDAPQISPLYIATVTGIAKNISNKPLKSVFINYKVDGKNTSTMIFDLGPGQERSFTTNSVKTRGKYPPFNLENLQFEEYN